MPDGSNLVIGQVNTETSTTELQNSGGDVTAAALSVYSTDGAAIEATSRYSIGFQGQSDFDNGVIGVSGQEIGVLGESDGSPGVGVMGVAKSDDSIAVFGTVQGERTDSAAVWGQTGPGVVNWPAVGGYSSGGVGVRGVSDAPAADHTSIGVVGFSQNGHGVAGYTSSPSMYGGIFLGGLVVFGKKSSAVRHPGGSHRLLYCMESPESWFEDFGRAKLVRGRSTVKRWIQASPPLFVPTTTTFFCALKAMSKGYM
jgi:hypothetical protein